MTLAIGKPVEPVSFAGLVFDRGNYAGNTLRPRLSIDGSKGFLLPLDHSSVWLRAAAGTDIQYVIPRQSMLIELPIAVLKSSSNRDVANKFIRFVKGDSAQDLLAQYGFRPVDPKIAKMSIARPS